MTSYQADVARIEQEIATISLGTATALSPGAERQTRLLYLRFQHASITGRLGALRPLNADIDALIGNTTQHGDLWLLKAFIAVKLHRFAEAESFLSSDLSLSNSPPATLLLSDIDLQFGRYDSARNRIEAALAHDRSWDALARLAYLSHTTGDLHAADRLYAEAEDELTAKQMHSFAWLALQRGAMYFSRGQYQHAAKHYARADRAYPGYWMVDERLAELDGAQGSFGTAIARYERLYRHTPKPEWEHALGDLHALAGKAAAAHAWKTKALDHYLESTARGELHLLHYLVDLCCEMPASSGLAVTWARRDVELRPNSATLADLAWALYRDRQIDHAAQHIERALAFGIVSSRIYLQAACIFAAAGQIEPSTRYMRLARQTNPAPAKARAVPFMRAQPGV